MRSSSGLLLGVLFMNSCNSTPPKSNLNKIKITLQEMTSNTQKFDLPWGGFSGLHFQEKDSEGNLFFWTLTDRGPNGDEIKKGHEIQRAFLKPDFTPSILRLKFSPKLKTLDIVQVIPFKNSKNELMSGLPPKNNKKNQKFELAIDDKGKALPTDEAGVDSESIAVDSNKHFWIGEEYLPSILEFSPEGKLLSRIAPAADEHKKLEKNQLPFDYHFRKLNRGFEALSYFNHKIFLMTQSPLVIPDQEIKAHFIRIAVFNTETRKYEAEYLFPLLDKNADKIGDMQMINDHQFYVIEQNGDVGAKGIHNIFKGDLAKATNLMLHSFKNMPEKNNSFSNDFNFVQKELIVNLADTGYSEFEKIEGLTIIDENTLAIINDNDFGVEDNKMKDHKKTVLGIIHLK